MNVNEKGHLMFGGLDTVGLAEEYGTPLYLMDEGIIRENCRVFKGSIERFYGGAGLVCFASKAFCCRAMMKIIMEEGLGTDVVSAGELHTAMSVGFPMEKVFFHGNNKTVGELKTAVSNRVGRIVVDNITELFLLNDIAREASRTVDIMIRIKPGVDAHTHDFVRTGKIDSKFGFALETGEAFEAVKSAISLENIRLTGVHCHIGSQILSVEPFVEAADIMLGFMAKIKDELSYELNELNLGGGFGIRYTEDNIFVPFEKYMEYVSERLKKRSAELNFRLPFVIIEPGRSIAGGAGMTLYKVGAVKEIPGIRTYVSVDGGLSDNPRYSLYGSKYEVTSANKANLPKTETVTIAGRICEKDLLGENMKIQPVGPDDIIAFFGTGAYTYSMASNYNRLPKPPVVMLRGGKARVAVKGETLDDLIRNDLL